MYSKFKISHHRHSGRLLAHEFTSYLPLMLLVVVTAAVLSAYTFSDLAQASTPYTGPEGGSIGLTGVVPAKPPTTAAVITSPTNGQHFKESPVKVSGTCPADTLIEIFKNNIFAGSAPCTNGKFSLEIDLMFGKNTLTGQVFDALNQAGPVSNPVTVFYDFALPGTDPLSQLDLSGSQMLLTTNSVYRGTFPGQNLNVPVTIIGGTPPYAVNVQWGDAKNKVIPRSNNQTFNADHIYDKPGTFGITLQATDSLQRTAFLTVAAIVNGQPSVISGTGAKQSPNKVLMLWPVLAIAATMVVSFWMGEKREKKIISGKISPQHPGLNTSQAAQKPAPPTTTDSTQKPPQ